MRQKQLQTTLKEKSGLKILKEAVRSVARSLVRSSVSSFLSPFIFLTFSSYRRCLCIHRVVIFFPHFSDLERTLNLNLGQQEEFSPLQGQCFEYTDRE